MAVNPEVEQRFWDKVTIGDDCWLWTASRTAKGYGQFWVDGRVIGAHKVSWEIANGPVPPGLLLDHKPTCPRHCVRPDHLRIVTYKQNAENRVAQRRGVTQLDSGKWMAQVTSDYQHHYLGVYDTVEEASEVARLKRIELFTHNDLDRNGA